MPDPITAATRNAAPTREIGIATTGLALGYTYIGYNMRRKPFDEGAEKRTWIVPAFAAGPRPTAA